MSVNSYYTGIEDLSPGLLLKHSINNVNADIANRAPMVDRDAKILYKIENTGNIELYKVSAYHDAVAPVNGRWIKQCVFEILMPGDIRYCKRDIRLSERVLNHSMGHAIGKNAISGATSSTKASNPTYFNV